MQQGQPQVAEHLIVGYPLPNVLCLTLNRPQQLNAMTDALEADLCAMLDWAEEEPSIYVIIITGTGGRVFCAGQDLKGWLTTSRENKIPQGERIANNRNGFGSIARRRSKKTLICALNGHAFGGGAELLFNCDIIIGFNGGIVCFPEVRRGVVAGVGGIPNLMGRSPTLVPYLLAGIAVPEPLLRAHVLTEVVEKKDVMASALKWAKLVTECSPDAVWVTKEQVNLHKDGLGIQEVIKASVESEQSIETYKGANLKEGLLAFTEKRDTIWTVPPRLPSQVKAKL